jgi:uncharacterized protein (DUF1800 family)
MKIMLVCTLSALLAGCAAPAAGPADQNPPKRLVTGPSLELQADALSVLNRVTWGVNPSTLALANRLGLERYLDQQLHPTALPLPGTVQAQIAAMTISQRSLESLGQALEKSRKEADAILDDEQKRNARQAYQKELTRLAREAATRSLLRSLYSPNQLHEQLTWFWMNHFNIYQGKANLRAMVGDYEEQAIRPHALGKFRDLLSATVHHPAMLRYLDNEQNAVNRINENYARELLELHTLGVKGGYSQRDVQELARILTGVGVNLGLGTPSVRRELQSQYVHLGLFEFNPNRHDYGDKQLLGQTVRGRGLNELDQVLDRLSRHPATAHFISSKLAIFFVADDPPAALVERMTQTFLSSDGDIAATLHTLLTSSEFAQSLGRKFKDPVHYLVSALRLAYDDQPVLNAAPMLNWLSRMGEPLYGHPTPDGYPMKEAAWTSPGQMMTRFEIAKAIGTGELPAPVQLANPAYFEALQKTFSTGTRQALEQARSAPERAAFLLASPEMMHR